jgi:hypothetical protein
MPPGAVTKPNSIRLLDLCRFYRQLPHQTAALQELEEAINKANPHILGRNQAWFKTWSQSGKILEVTNDWNGILKAARIAGAKYPELVAAQWQLESNGGKATSGRNNFFGLKGSGTSTTTQEFINGQWITVSDSFINFPDIQTCVTYLVDRWYKDYKTYKGVNNAETRDDAARQLQAQGYATDPKYAEKLIRVMNQKIPAATESPGSYSLKVPYEYQLDNKSGQGYRECFSSSCAMVARYWGKIGNDDAYNVLRRKHGDSTSVHAQIATLRELGLKADFIQDATAADLEEQIKEGRPTPVGWLHRGPVSSPSGTGHWSVAIGFTPTHFIHNDPNGEADLVNGGYVSNKGGAGVAYSKKNWLPRWLIDGPDSGWFLRIRPA